MANLPENIRDREYAVFDTNSLGEAVKRVKGEMTPTGLTIGGLMTVTALTTVWVALPATPLTQRNTMALQNQSDNGGIILINYVGSGSVGWRIYDGGSVEFPITDNILIYARMVSGTGSVLTDEVA